MGWVCIPLHKSRAAGARLLEAASEAAVSAAENVLDQRARQLRYRQESFQQKTEKAEALEKLDLLILVNPWNPMPEGYEPALQSVGEEQAMDTRCAGALLQMLEDCRAAENHPYICSTYRSRETQQALYDNKILRLILSGVSWEEAPEIAGPLGGCARAPASISSGWRRISLMSFIPIWTRARRTRAPSSGSWKTPGATALSCAIPTTARRSPVSFTSPGITAMWARNSPRRFMNPGLRWRNIQPGGGDAEAFPAGGRSGKRRQRRAAWG